MAACSCSNPTATQPPAGTTTNFTPFAGESMPFPNGGAPTVAASQIMTPTAGDGFTVTLSLEWLIILGLAIALLFAGK